jgi:hypothetical protein
VKVPWPIRSVIAGTAGTAALSLAYVAERKLRPRHQGPLDYDDSLVPGQIVASPPGTIEISAGHCDGATGRRSACGTDCSAGALASHGRA